MYVCGIQLADGDAERPHYCRLASQSSISSHLSTSLEHVMSVMAYHPKYLHCFQQTHYYLMHEDGSLPFDFRHYIAIMVSRLSVTVTVPLTAYTAYRYCVNVTQFVLFQSILHPKSLVTGASSNLVI